MIFKSPIRLGRGSNIVSGLDKENRHQGDLTIEAYLGERLVKVERTKYQAEFCIWIPFENVTSMEK